MLYDHMETLRSVAREDVPHVDRMLHELDAYARSEGRAIPGDFLTAIIVGDLYEAALRADDVNAKYLREYIKYVLSRLPDMWVGLAVQPLKAIRDTMGGKAALNRMMVKNATPEFLKALRVVTWEVREESRDAGAGTEGQG